MQPRKCRTHQTFEGTLEPVISFEGHSTLCINVVAKRMADRHKSFVHDPNINSSVWNEPILLRSGMRWSGEQPPVPRSASTQLPADHT